MIARPPLNTDSRKTEWCREGKSVSVILPAYNEEANIARCINQCLTTFPKYFHEVCVIAVNDGSSDRTAQICATMAAQDARIKPLQHAVNRGYGSALRSGFAAAKSDYVFFTDADGQFDTEEVTRLLKHIEHYDMVFGYRARRADPFHRKLNTYAWGKLVQVLFGIGVKDIDCAFKIFHRKVLDEVLPLLVTSGAMISTELLAQALKKGFTFTSVAVSHYPRRAGTQSGANPLVIMRAFVELFKLYWKIP